MGIGVFNYDQRSESYKALYLEMSPACSARVPVVIHARVHWGIELCDWLTIIESVIVQNIT